MESHSYDNFNEYTYINGGPLRLRFVAVDIFELNFEGTLITPVDNSSNDEICCLWEKVIMDDCIQRKRAALIARSSFHTMSQQT